MEIKGGLVGLILQVRAKGEVPHAPKTKGWGLLYIEKVLKPGCFNFGRGAHTQKTEGRGKE